MTNSLNEEEVPLLYDKLDELSQQIETGFKNFRAKKTLKKPGKVPRHWTEQEVAHSFDTRKRISMLRRMFVEAEQ